MVNILVAVAIGVLTAVTAYLGTHVTMHPAETEKQKVRYKAGFIGCGIVVCVLIGLQTYRNNQAQSFLNDQLSRIEKNTKEPPKVELKPTINVPPSQVIIEDQEGKNGSLNAQSAETALTLDYWGVVDTLGNTLIGSAPLNRYGFYAVVNASKMPTPMRTKFDMAIICGFVDPLVDSHKDTRVTASPLFSWQDHFEAIAPIKSVLENALMEKWRAAARQDLSNLPGSARIQATTQIWISVVLLPKGLDVSNIRRLDDVQLNGGVISEAGASISISKPFLVSDLLK